MVNNKQGQFWLENADLDKLSQDFEDAVKNDDGRLNILPSRASIKRQFAYLSQDNLETLTEALDELEDKIGSTDTQIRNLSEKEIDDLVEELLTVRKLNDILSSREDVLKQFAKDVISQSQLEPDKTAGSLVSYRNNIKISKEIRGGKLSIDVNLLKEKLTDAQFQSVTNMITTTTTTVMPNGKFTTETTTRYEVNEKFLEAAMVRGEILSEDIFLSSVESKRTIAIALRNLDE